MEKPIYIDIKNIDQQYQFLEGSSTGKSRSYFLTPEILMKIFTYYKGLLSFEFYFEFEGEKHFELLSSVHLDSFAVPKSFILDQETHFIHGFSKNFIDGVTLSKLDKNTNIGDFFQSYPILSDHVNQVTSKGIRLKDINSDNFIFDGRIKILDFDASESIYHNRGDYDLDTREYIKFDYDKLRFADNINPINLHLYYHLIKTSTIDGIATIRNGLGLKNYETPDSETIDIMPYIYTLVSKMSEYNNCEVNNIGEAQSVAQRILSK